MSSLSASSQGNIKHVMRTALVGIKPADQVMLKGYLRVLLRLEADLEWVSANHPKVDLFMINDDFRHADNIVKLLQKQSKIPALYISQIKAVNGEGQLDEDLLTLPLKQMHLLNHWLFTRVDVLRKQDNGSQRNGSATRSIEHQQAQPALKESTSYEQSNANGAEQAQNSFFSSKRYSDNRSANQTSESSTNTANKEATPIPMQELHQQAGKEFQSSRSEPSLIELIKLLQKGSVGNYQLILNHNVIATVEPSKSLVWENTDIPKSLREGQLSEWRIQSITGHPYKKSEAKDLKQWLWDYSWERTSELLDLIDETKTYHLRHWIKPTQQQDRRNLLRVMTAMEPEAITIKNISEISETSIEYTKKVVAGLLFSNHLQPDSYETLTEAPRAVASATEKEQQNVQPEPNLSPLDSVLSRRAAGEAPRSQPSSAIPTSVSTPSNLSASEPPKKQKKEKLGFLSRLRRKLGL